MVLNTNGLGPIGAVESEAMTPDDIISVVDALESERSELHTIMDGDWDFYNQRPYGGDLDDDGKDRLAGYAHFTSTNPTTYMDLALHMGSTSKRIIRVKEPREVEAEAEINNMSELFALGALKGADELRADRLMPDLQTAGFAMSCFRGRVCYRALMRREETPEEELPPEVQEERRMYLDAGYELPRPTRTYVEIMDWDPRNVYFRMGPKGLEWACEKSWKSRMQIIEEYGVDPAEGDLTIAGQDFERNYAVYDYFDKVGNTVICEGDKVLKEMEPHEMTRVPVGFAYADNRPFFQQDEGGDRRGKDNSYEYGQGFYHSNRALFPEINYMYSVAKELSHRAIKPGLKAFSRDGTLTLDQGDPHETGQVYPLSTSNEENFEEVTSYELTPTALQMMGITGAMEQRGAFPLVEFGALAQPLAGVAISELRSNRLAPMTTHIRAVQSAIRQCLEILRAAYATGKFGVMTMSGYMQDPKKTYFSRDIPPEEVRGGGMYEVEILPTLPHDDVAMIALITGIKQSGLPVDDRTLLEMLDFQDPQQLQRAHWEQVANQGSPMSMAYNAAKAAYEQGNEMLFSFWIEEFSMARMQKHLEMQQLIMVGGQLAAGGPMPGAGSPPGAGGGGGGGQAPPRRPRYPSSDVLAPEAYGQGHIPNQQAASAGAASQAGQPRNTGVGLTYGPGATPPWAR